MKDFDKSRHAVFFLMYHVIFVVKYRRKIFDNEEITGFLRSTMERISDNHEVQLVESGCGDDHLHFLIKSNPKLDLIKYINTAKTITSREIRRNFSEIKERLWGDHMWSPSYFISTSGNVTIDVLKQYIEDQ